MHPDSAVSELPLRADEDKTRYKWSRLEEALNIAITLYEELCKDAELYEEVRHHLTTSSA